jgi:aldose 1-epimerase
VSVAERTRRRHPSGEQYAISSGDSRADITQVGATLRRLRLGGQDVLDGFDVDERATDGRGQVLAPWPNRITDGSYSFGDVDCVAPLTEPARHDAIHGLVRWLDWAPVQQDVDAITLGCTLHPQPGYEWQLDLQVRYAVAASGLTVTLEVVNVGDTAAPFGAGFHPYLAIAGLAVDSLELTVPGALLLEEAGGPDQPPTWTDVQATREDFRRPRLIGPTALDTAYGELARGPDGLARARLSAPGHRTTELWVDASFGYLMVYTADAVGRPERRRRAVAVEPMTCPPEAFRTGVDVIALEPGRSWAGSWGLLIVDDAGA